MKFKFQKSDLAILLVAILLIAGFVSLLLEKSTLVETRIGNLSHNKASILILSEKLDRSGTLFYKGSKLSNCSDGISEVCIAENIVQRDFQYITVGNLRDSTDYTFEWSNKVLDKIFGLKQSSIEIHLRTAAVNANGPFIYRSYGRVLTDEGQPVKAMPVLIKSRDFKSLTEQNEQVDQLGDLIAVTNDNGTFSISSQIDNNSNFLQDAHVYYKGEVVREFKATSFNSKPYPDFLIPEDLISETDLNRVPFGGLLTPKPANAQAQTPEEIQEEQRDRILCKPGENYGTRYPVPNSLLAEAKANNFSWVEALIVNLNEDMAGYKDTVVRAFDNGLTPVLRICFLGSDCPTSGTAYGQAVLNVYAQLGAEGTLPSNGLYVHAGHNEPNVSEYRSPDEEAKFVADFINVLKAADIITNVQNDSGIKVISPQMDLYHRNGSPDGIADVGLGHPVYEASAYVRALNSNGAFAGVKGDIYAWSVNDYWHDRGPVVASDIREFQGLVSSLGMSNKIFVTELGRMNRSVSWGDFSNHVNEVMSIEDVESVMLFNSIGANPDPTFNYHLDLQNDNPSPGSLFNGCGGDGYLIFRQEKDIETGAGTPGGSPAPTPGGTSTGTGTTGTSTTSGTGTTSGNPGTTTGTTGTSTGTNTTGSDSGTSTGTDGNQPPLPGNPPICYRNATNILNRQIIGAYRVRGNEPLTPVNVDVQDPLGHALRPVSRFTYSREYELQSNNFVFTSRFVISDRDSEIRVYEDLNGNCVQDAGENFVDPNGPDDQIDTRNLGDVVEVNFEAGIQMFSFTHQLRDVNQASQIIKAINDRGGYATAVGKYTQATGWTFYNQRDGTAFAPDYTVNSKEPMYVNVHAPAVVPFRIGESNGDAISRISNGWNFVPVYSLESESYVSREVLATFPAPDPLPDALILAKWMQDRSRYISTAIIRGNEVGEEYDVMNGDALFVYTTGLPDEGVEWAIVD